jgi:hypothetical protein
MQGQLDLLALLDHRTEVYRLDHLWGTDRSTWHIGPWWAWRCSCGRDVGAEQRAAYGWEAGAEEMAAAHRDREGWTL